MTLATPADTAVGRRIEELDTPTHWTTTSR
jgi:hypothetical protein